MDTLTNPGMPRQIHRKFQLTDIEETHLSDGGRSSPEEAREKVSALEPRQSRLTIDMDAHGAMMDGFAGTA